ncbi:MAG: GGDEF domain-containing protein [Marinicella sp.]
MTAYQTGLTGEVENSILQFQAIKSDCQAMPVVVEVESLLANMYAISGEYQLALTSLDNMLSKIESISDESLRLLVYSSAYLVYDLLNQNQLSHDFAQIVIDFSPKPKPKQLCSAYVHKYISLIKLHLAEDLDKEIKDVLDYCRQNGENLYAEGLNVNWIDYKLKLAETNLETQKVYEMLQSSSDSIMSTQYKNIIVFKDSLMARILEQLNRKEEAVEYAKRALEGTITLGNSQQKIDALKVLYNYYESIGDYQQANTYLLEKNLTEIKYYSDKQEKLMAYQTIKHDSLAKQHQIKTLNQQNEVLMLEKELAVKSKANQLLLTYLFGSLVILLLYIGYRIRKQQKIYKSLSEMDYMTKIYNRKGMKDYMEYMLPYSEKKAEVIAFSIFDLDLFKKINDEYGHTVGDWVIKATVEACKQLEYDKATFARLGGEEFAIIMRDSSLEDIKGFAEKCRSAIYSIETNYETGHRFNISASFGITTTEISGYDLTQLLKDADEALYKSKENGRNQVTTFSPASD